MAAAVALAPASLTSAIEHLAAFAGEALGDGLAQALRAAGDDRDAV